MRLLLIFLMLPLTVFSQVNPKYEYPVNSKTGKIEIDREVEVSATKAQLFKRAEQFIGMRNFGETFFIKSHSKKQVNMALVKQPVTYKDAEAGKIFGNGYFPFQYRGHDYFYILFKYRMYVLDDMYHYILEDFQVIEIMEPGFATESRVEMNMFSLEDFTNRMVYSKSHPTFVKEVNKFIKELKDVMTGKI